MNNSYIIQYENIHKILMNYLENKKSPVIITWTSENGNNIEAKLKKTNLDENLIKNYSNKDILKLPIENATNISTGLKLTTTSRISIKAKDLKIDNILFNDFIATGKLIFISDLEGCASFTMDFKTPQSTQICSEEFFDNLDSFMESNPNNKIAFLGDYFDKGSYFASSIDRIIGLYDKYNKGLNTKINNNSFKKRVYIILGNRDINKLRLLFELKNIVKKDNIVLNNTKLWNLWKNFYPKYFNTTDLSEKFKIIIEDSMGAMPFIEKNKINEYYKNLYQYFVNVLNPSNKNNENENNNDKRTRKNFWKLFTYGKIVDYDSDFKVLLSHAGGIGSFLFHTQQYYDNIKEKLLQIKGDDMILYFQNIEIARKELMKPPKDETTIFNLSTINKNGIRNLNQKNIKEILTILNSPLINFMKDKSINNPDFYLLQALGLKPDNPATDYFVSFVQSCDCIFCKGPRARNMYTIEKNNTVKKNIYNKNIYLEFLEDLKKLNVKFIAFGHNPHCAPVPVIYKRADDISSSSNKEDKIIFIGNDVSNGFRAANINQINKIPLAYISKFPDEVGVGFLNKLENASNINAPRANSNLIAESLKPFKSMINKWGYDKVPEFSLDTKTIKYNTGTLSFPAREPRMIFNKAVMK